MFRLTVNDRKCFACKLTFEQCTNFVENDWEGLLEGFHTYNNKTDILCMLIIAYVGYPIHLYVKRSNPLRSKYDLYNNSLASREGVYYNITVRKETHKVARASTQSVQGRLICLKIMRNETDKCRLRLHSCTG